MLATKGRLCALTTELMHKAIITKAKRQSCGETPVRKVSKLKPNALFEKKKYYCERMGNMIDAGIKCSTRYPKTFTRK